MKPSDQRTLLIIICALLAKWLRTCVVRLPLCATLSACVLSRPLLRLRCLSAQGATFSAHSSLVCLTCLCVLFGVHLCLLPFVPQHVSLSAYMGYLTCHCVHLCLFCMLCLCVLSFASACSLAFFACSFTCLCMLVT